MPPAPAVLPSSLVEEFTAQLRRRSPLRRCLTPIICLEPSCASVFTDELRNLFPNENQAQRLGKQVALFVDF